MAKRPSSPTPAEALSPRRTATVFLSYARADQGATARLQTELRRRGLHAWRDLTDLPTGTHTVSRILAAIEAECDACILLVTDAFMASDFIWRYEVPAALRRVAAQPSFGILPLLSGVTPRALRARCAEAGVADLSAYNGRVEDAMRGSAAARLRAVSGATLEAVVRARAAAGVEAFTVLLRTASHRGQLPGPDLDLDWSDDFPAPCAPPRRWKESLLPALVDVRDVLARHGGRVEAELFARMAPALAFGHVLSEAAQIRLRVHERGAVWTTTRARPSRARLVAEDRAATGAPSVAAVEVAIARETSTQVSAYLTASGIAPGRRVCLRPADGASTDAIADADAADDMARQTAALLRTLSEAGASRTHLFLAAPPGWVALLGHLLSSVGRLTVHQYHPDADTYEPAFTLG